jgi:hypothetical protein
VIQILDRARCAPAGCRFGLSIRWALRVLFAIAAMTMASRASALIITPT